jgi:glutathione synthase/RimK-type ligase-like ATP-grasp enzyme
MNKVTLLGSKDAGEKNSAPEMLRLARENLSGRPDFRVVYWEDLLFDIVKGRQSVIDMASGDDIGGTGLVMALNWYRGGPRSMYKDAAFALALYLQDKGVKFWNEEMVRQHSISKLSAAMQLSLLGQDVAATRYSLGRETMLKLETEFPVIMKAAQSSRGRNNYLVEDKDGFNRYLELGEDGMPNQFILQEYIPNDSDLRLVCAGGEPQLCIRRQRTSNDTHLNNVSQGAEATKVDLTELDPAILQSCREICRGMGRNVAGIDLIQASDGSGRNVFLEVNALPQLTSGAFVTEKVTAVLELLAQEAERKAE